MAINIKNYVDISTTFPSAGIAGRSFGGLVFTASDMLPQSDADLKEAYDIYMGGGVAYLTATEVQALFGGEKDEYKFALGYYGYSSPSGRYASRLAYAKVQEGERPIDAFIRINEVTNLFGSFTFLSLTGGGSSTSTTAADDSDDDIEMLKEVAAFNSGLDAKYLFVVNRVRGDSAATDVVNQCKVFSGAKGTVFVSGASDVSAYMPMAILASTDYSAGSVVNYMFKQFTNEEPTVFKDSVYTLFNKNLVNFYGRTQTNGQTLDFYQRGFNTDGTDTAIYCNEMWFKSACETELLTLLSGIERLSADSEGVSLVEATVSTACAQGVRNGSFMPKEAGLADRRAVAEIVQAAGSSIENADNILVDVARYGYAVFAYLGAMSGSEKLGATTEYFINYYVFYGTADSIRYIKGNNILIK